ncbi:MAG: pyridoxamine kinase [Clostridia bacterium]|nr:pyridoxamine kinase [Clostridia bacterium]
MKTKRILTVQDISCVGQCSLTVALPVISACGAETCILPSAVLSNHTADKFHGFTFHDLTEEMSPIITKWADEGIAFDAVYTGYLGSKRQIDLVLDAMTRCLVPGGLRIIDPAMADGGKLYTGFDGAFVHEMKRLCAGADYLLPNITEACLLTDTPYQEQYDKVFVGRLCGKLHGLGAKNIILTGVGFDENSTGVWISQQGDASYYRHDRERQSRHGTGDIFASAFTGLLLTGKSAYDAAAAAADFVLACMRATNDDDDRWYGVHFEPVLPQLMKAVYGE